MLANGKYEAIETAQIAAALGLPTTTVRRVLEDLAAYQLAVREKQGSGNSDLWKARMLDDVS